MIEYNVDSGAGALLSEIQQHLEGAGSPTSAFNLILQKQIIEDRMRFQRWLHESRMIGEQVEQDNAKAAASTRLMRRTQHLINSM